MDNELLYTVTCINGFRRMNLTRIGAFDLARDLIRDWKRSGVTAQAKVWYRDGAEVAVPATDGQYA